MKIASVEHGWEVWVGGACECTHETRAHLLSFLAGYCEDDGDGDSGATDWIEVRAEDLLELVSGEVST